MNLGCENFYFQITEDMPTYTSALIACENSHFILAPRRLGHLKRRNVGDQATEFHTDEVNQCLHIKSVVMAFRMQI